MVRFTTRALPAGTYLFDDRETAGTIDGMPPRPGRTDTAHTPTHAWSDSPLAPHEIEAGSEPPPSACWRRASGPHLLAPLRLRLGRPRHRPHLDRRRHDPRRSAILPRRDTTWQQVSVDLTPFTGRDEVTVLFTVISDVVHREVKMRPRILAPFLAVTGEGPPHGRSL